MLGERVLGRDPIAEVNNHGGGRVYGSVNPTVFDRTPISATSILDIGCGDGMLGRALKARAPCRVTGVTSSGDEFCRAEAVLDAVVRTDLDTGDLTALGRFDAVICSHVLEHLRDPGRLLNRLQANLAENGLLIVALPNPLYWRQRLAFAKGKFRYTQGGIMDDTHLRFFDWVTARELVQNAGYRIVEALADGGLPGSRFLSPALGRVLDRLAIATRPGLFGVQFVITARHAMSASP